MSQNTAPNGRKMRGFRIFPIALISLLTIFTLTSCGTDVVANYAIRSLEELQQKAGVVKQDRTTVIGTPSGCEFSYGEQGATIILPSAPFLKAGLDVKKLPESIVSEGASLYIHQDYIADSVETLIRKQREKVSYHEALDHYGIDMGNGNKFEWAKDLAKNDKDIVFVLNPKPFADAGVDPNKVDGFVYTEVEVKKGVKEMKLLSVTDLDNAQNKDKATLPEEEELADEANPE